MRFPRRRETSIQHIAQSILSDSIRIYSNLGSSPQQHEDVFEKLIQVNSRVKAYKCMRANPRTFTYRVDTDLASMIIKYPGKNEAQKLVVLKNMPEANAPRLLACQDEWMAQQCIAGELMSVLLKQSRSRKADYFDTVLTQLVTIHCLIKNRRINRSKLREERMGNDLFNLVFSALRRIQDAIGAHGGATGQWQRTVDTIMQELSAKLFQEVINPDDSYVVLSHGDYKPDNLMIVDETSCYPIDWVYMGKASCWYDLGYFITIPLDYKERAAYLSQYTRQMRTRGWLKSLDDRLASILYLKGRMCAEITMAGANADKISQAGNRREFARAMDELTRLLSEYEDLIG